MRLFILYLIMFRRRYNIICKSLRIFPFKTGPYKNVCNVIRLMDTKNNETNMFWGIKNNTEEVFHGIFSDFCSDKGDVLSENESENDIWSQTGQVLFFYYRHDRMR